jgi:hypothetical protein
LATNAGNVALGQVVTGQPASERAAEHDTCCACIAPSTAGAPAVCDAGEGASFVAGDSLSPSVERAVAELADELSA